MSAYLRYANECKDGLKNFFKIFADVLGRFKTFVYVCNNKTKNIMEIIDGLITPHNGEHITLLNEKGLIVYPTDEGFYNHLSAFGITLKMLFENPLQHAEAYLENVVRDEIILFFSEQGKHINSLVIRTDGTGFHLYYVETTEAIKTEILELLS